MRKRRLHRARPTTAVWGKSVRHEVLSIYSLLSHTGDMHKNDGPLIIHRSCAFKVISLRYSYVRESDWPLQVICVKVIARSV